MIIRRDHLLAPVALGFCLLVLLACAPPGPPGSEPMSKSQIPALAPGMARVWFLRDKDPKEQHGMPIIYANSQPIGRSQPGTAFFRDFPPGSYAFTVESYDIQTGQKVVLQLTAGAQAYLDIGWGESWQHATAGGETFYVHEFSPELGQAHLRALSYVGST